MGTYEPTREQEIIARQKEKQKVRIQIQEEDDDIRFKNFKTGGINGK